MLDQALLMRNFCRKKLCSLHRQAEFTRNIRRKNVKAIAEWQEHAYENMMECLCQLERKKKKKKKKKDNKTVCVCVYLVCANTSGARRRLGLMEALIIGGAAALNNWRTQIS